VRKQLNHSTYLSLSRFPNGESVGDDLGLAIVRWYGVARSLEHLGGTDSFGHAILVSK
jgi:hypothetical protein